jgi:hypothetical protein
MSFEEILDQAIAMLQRRGRVTYRLLKRQFQLDDDTLDDLLAELRYAYREAISEDEQGMVWTGEAAVLPPPLPQRCSLSSPLSLRRPRRHKRMLCQRPRRPLTLNAVSSPCCFVIS